MPRPRRHSPRRVETTVVLVVGAGLRVAGTTGSGLLAGVDGRENRKAARRVDIPRRVDQTTPLLQGASVPPRVGALPPHLGARVGAAGQTVHRPPSGADLVERIGDDPKWLGPHPKAITAHGCTPTDAKRPTRPRPETTGRLLGRGGHVATRVRGLGPTRLAFQVLRGARPPRTDDQTQTEVRQARLRNGQTLVPYQAMSERPAEITPYEAGQGANQDVGGARALAEQTSGTDVRAAAGAIARAVAAGLLLIQIPVDGLAVPSEAGSAKTTVRDQGVLKRLRSATVGVALPRPVGTPPSGPLRRLHLADVEGRRHEEVRPVHQTAKAAAGPSEVGPVLLPGAAPTATE